MSATLHIDLNEGRSCELGCLWCRSDVLAVYVPAHQAPRMYKAALECWECSEPLVTFDAMTGGVIQ